MQTLSSQVAPTTIEETVKRKMGRPSKITEETLRRLEEQWAVGANDVQACFIAGINPKLLYDYQTRHPEYSLRKEAIKGNIALNAKHTIARHVKKDPHLALDVISRLEKNEWSVRTELTGAEGKDFTFSFVEPKADSTSTN